MLMTTTWKMVSPQKKGKALHSYSGSQKIQNQALLSGLAYCVSSCSMILVNKFVLSGYAFNAPVFLMLYQVYYWCLLSISHATQLCACLKASFSCSVTAEHCISDYSFYTIPVRCCSNRTINMESNQSLVACVYHLCWNSAHKHI